VELVSQQEAQDHCSERRSLHPERHRVVVVQDVIVLEREECALPEAVVIVAKEITVEDKAREERADRKEVERYEHYRRRFMHVMHDFFRRTRLTVERQEDQTP